MNQCKCDWGGKRKKMVTQDVNNVKQRAQLSFRNNFWVNKHPLVPYACVPCNSDTVFVLEWRNWQLFWLWDSSEEAEGWQIGGQGVCRVPETEVSGARRDVTLWSEIKCRGGEMLDNRGLGDVNTRQNIEGSETASIDDATCPCNARTCHMSCYRCLIEEHYGKALIKLAKSCSGKDEMGWVDLYDCSC